MTRATPIHMEAGRDHWYHELMADADAGCEPESMDAEDLLYILYTSGTTGKPKGVVHTTGGYLTQVHATTQVGVRPERRRRLLVHRRCRVGHGAQLHRVRPAVEWSDRRDVRGRAELAGEGSLLGTVREVRGGRSSTPRLRRSVLS